VVVLGDERLLEAWRAASEAYSFAELFSHEDKELDKLASELLYLREHISDLLELYYFGNARKAKAEEGKVRARVRDLVTRVIELLGERITPERRRYLQHLFSKVG
jgi:hypothetical protein